MNPRTSLSLLLALLCLLAVPAGAQAKPNGFMGVDAGGLAFDGGPKLDAGLKAMRKRGVGTLRVSFYWRVAQPYAQASEVPAGQGGNFVEVDGRPTDWRSTDSAVGRAAAHGISILPMVIGVPRWAATPYSTWAPPASPKAYGRFVAQLAARYGPKGTFWTANPSIPKIPIRAWQIWNEPAGFSGFQDTTSFWNGPRAQALPTYVAMLKASRARLRKVDRKGKIVAAGLFGQSWKTMDQLYDAGAGKYFDTVAIHPYARTTDAVVALLRLVRKAMASNGDSRKPLTITEFGWTSSRGKVTTDAGYIESDSSGQATLLRQAYRALWKARKELRLTSAYWHTWATTDSSTTDPFDYSGLNRLTGDGSTVPKPSASAYRKVAAELRRG